MPGYLRQDSETALKSNYFDPVNKLRTSQAQALIDTDFEYGMQITKWENIAMVNNRPFAFQSSNSLSNISAPASQSSTTTGMYIPAGSNIVTVFTSSAHGLVVGQEVVVQDTFLSIANGNFTVDTVAVDNLSFTYTARATNTALSGTPIVQIYDTNKTAIYLGTAYTNAPIGGIPIVSILNSGVSNRAVKVTTAISGTTLTQVPHGLSVGNEIAITGITTTGTNPPNGSFTVARIEDAYTFWYYVGASSIPSGTLTTTNAKIYVRPQGQFLHRPFDGGVIFSANAASNNQQAIRQTRRYFRYQSGKGLQMSSGTVMKPSLAVESITSSGLTVTVQTKEQHNLQPGSTVTIIGCNEVAYNGDFSVIQITGYNTFQYTALATPSKTKASGEYSLTIKEWYGCTNRLGMFDSQNGVFFEFDGQKLYAVRRSSTYQLSGKVSVKKGESKIVQTNSAFPTNFSNQLSPGDFIVIRGQSYRVESIASNTELNITPGYRGASADYAQYSKTIDVKIPQSEWNLDTMDGNGPSGYKVDLTKMQMFYIDYSWYGAGFIRFGMRGIDGTVHYSHKILNNNANSEAYMRSGNLPGRYESVTFPKTTQLTGNLPANSSVTEMSVKSVAGFAPGATALNPNAVGSLLVRSGTAYEYMNYTGIDTVNNKFTGLIRAQSGTTTNLTIAAGSNIGIAEAGGGLQVGQRVISSAFPDNTYISEIVGGSTIKFNTAALTANPTGVIFPALNVSSADANLGQIKEFTLSPESPISVEQAFPTYSSSISHWGTSVIMDGNFDDDKSLIFTFGQTNKTTIPAAVYESTPLSINSHGTIPNPKGATTIYLVSGNADWAADKIVTGMSVNSIIANNPFQKDTVIKSIDKTNNSFTISLPLTAALPAGTAIKFWGGNVKALFSIRVAPSIDNSVSAKFGARELINRMQLTLRSLAVTTKGVTVSSVTDPAPNILVTAILNGVPSTATPWKNAVQNSTVLTNSSLAQVADYSVAPGGATKNETIITGGEVTGGFYVNGTTSVDLTDVRDLGNSILGGGEENANTNVYPDGPDVLSIVVTNLSTLPTEVLGRLGWSEAQA